MNSIAKNLQHIRATLPDEVTLIAVSKTKPVSDLMEAYTEGQRIFGENKIQEMTEKWEVMPKDIAWHMIGHVQTNKVKYMAPYVTMIHAVDSLKLLKEINKQAEKHNRIIQCLLQIKIAAEDTKFGLTPQEATEILVDKEALNLPYVTIQGLMGMATFTEDTIQISKEFQKVTTLFQELQPKFPALKVLSIGMSGDYTIAINSGSTMVRVGSAIFGHRNYVK